MLLLAPPLRDPLLPTRCPPSSQRQSVQARGGRGRSPRAAAACHYSSTWGRQLSLYAGPPPPSYSQGSDPVRGPPLQPNEPSQNAAALLLPASDQPPTAAEAGRHKLVPASEQLQQPSRVGQLVPPTLADGPQEALQTAHGSQLAPPLSEQPVRHASLLVRHLSRMHF